MRPIVHLIIGLLASLIIYLSYPQISLLGLGIFLAASVLIDFDHYLYYFYKKKDWNPFKAYFWFIKKGKSLRKIARKQRKEFYCGFSFLHGLEWLVVLFLLGYFLHVLFYYILAGFALHLLLDIPYTHFQIARLDKFSLIYDYFKYKKLKFIDELESFI